MLLLSLFFCPVLLLSCYGDCLLVALVRRNLFVRFKTKLIDYFILCGGHLVFVSFCSHSICPVLLGLIVFARLTLLGNLNRLGRLKVFVHSILQDSLLIFTCPILLFHVTCSFFYILCSHLILLSRLIPLGRLIVLGLGLDILLCCLCLLGRLVLPGQLNVLG